MSSVRIRRAFIAGDGRLVHLRHAGSGPLLLLVHQSPRSSAELEPLIAHLADRYTVIAPDTPGNGWSDPIGVRGYRLAPFANALARLLDVIGVSRCLVYGFHTGAAIGGALAALHPDRVCAALLNGLPAFDAIERAELLTRYLPPFRPSWDGAHLAWAWARLREQTIFFPWFDHRPDSRMPFDVPPPAALDEAVLELCRAGDAYDQPYGAAFAEAGPELLGSIRCPVRVVATARDPLRPHLDRLAAAGHGALVGEIAPGLEPVAELLAALAGQVSGAPDAAIAIDQPARCRYVGDAVPTRLITRGDGAPVLLLPELGEDAEAVLDPSSLASGERQLAIDLAGHGAAAVPTEPGLAGLAAALADALRGAGIAGVAVRAGPWGTMLARRVASIAPDLQLAPTNCAPPGADRAAAEREAFAPPDFGGGHLLRLWHRARDGLLFDPWWDRRAEAAIPGQAAPPPHAVQARFLASLAAAPTLRALFKHEGDAILK